MLDGKLHRRASSRSIRMAHSSRKRCKEVGALLSVTMKAKWCLQGPVDCDQSRIACAEALQAATDHGISRVQVEMDSTILQKALVSPSMNLAACRMLIRDTRDFLNEHFVCSSVISIPRACNGIAHNLAKLAMCVGPG